MGFKQFLKVTLKMNSSCYGTVTGSGFAGCYVGPATKNGEQALEIYGTALKESYIFSRDDIANITNNGNSVEKSARGAMTSVTKYTLKMKDGKTIICSIDQNGPLHGNFEARVF